jgi:hypothetical protein
MLEEITLEQARAMRPAELSRYVERHPDAWARLMRAREEQERAHAPTLVGYWRPLDPSCDPTRDLRLLTTPDYSGALEYEGYVEALRAGRRVSRYVSETDLRIADVAGEKDYFEVLAARERARAEADFALPVPQPGTLDPERAERLAAWLEGGRDVTTYRGSARCRICGALNGSAELERDGYRYPSGLVHYVRDHGCAVPGLEHVTEGA